VSIRLGLWWTLLWAAWLLLAGTWSLWIAVLGGVLALPAAVLAVAAGAHGIGGVRVEPRWMLSLQPVGMFRGFCSVTAELVRAVCTRRHALGDFRTDDRASGPATPERRAWLELAESWTPTAYVIDIDPDRGERLSHVARVHRRHR
jgi:hypothetical protein